MTTEPIAATRNPADLVQPLHALLAHQLGLPSPLETAVGMLDRAARLAFDRNTGTATARHQRASLARAIALGERDFDDDSVREFDRGRAWVALDPHDTPASVWLSEAVRSEAQRAAATELDKHAAGIFQMLADEARRVVGIFQALPEPPAQLFTVGDPTTMLTRAAGHAETYSRVLAANDRFWAITRGADLVRGPAGHGYERFPDGAPRLAGTYRNWRLALGKDDEVRMTARHFRLWRCVVDGWEPGVWGPADIETRAQDRTFSAKLSRFGAAVGIPSGQPA